MATQIRRYQLTNPTAEVAELNTLIGGTALVDDAAGGAIKDIQYDDISTNATDLDEAMASLGYSFVAANPATTAAEAFAATIDHGDLAGLTTGADAGHTNLLSKQGGTMTGNIDLDGNRITNVPDTPTAGGDAINDNYLQSQLALQINNRDRKDSVRVKSGVDLVGTGWTSAGSGVGKTLTGPSASTALNTVDGVTVAVGDRVLVTESGTHNGIYVVTTLADGGAQAPVWTRATDFDANSEVTQGAYTSVAEGTAYATTAWILTTGDPITVDTTSQTWDLEKGQDFITAGDGLVRAGDVLSVDLAPDPGLVFTGGDLDVLLDPASSLSKSAAGIAVDAAAAGAITAGSSGLSVNVDGSTIQINGSNELEVIGGGGGSDSVLVFGNRRVGTTTTDRFLQPGFGQGFARATTVQWRAPRAGSLSNLYVRVGTPAGNGNNIVYTVRVNGTPSSLAVTLASTSNNGADTSNTAAVVAGDLVDIIVTKAAGVGALVEDVVASLEYS